MQPMASGKQRGSLALINILRREEMPSRHLFTDSDGHDVSIPPLPRGQSMKSRPSAASQEPGCILKDVYVSGRGGETGFIGGYGHP